MVAEARVRVAADIDDRRRAHKRVARRLAASYIAYARRTGELLAASDAVGDPKRALAALEPVLRDHWEAVFRDEVYDAMKGAGRARDLDTLVAASGRYTGMMGKQINEVSDRAFAEAYNAALGRGWDRAVAWQRVSQAYGLDPRQMRSWITAFPAEGYQPDQMPPGTAKQIGGLLRERGMRIGDNEAWSLIQTGRVLDMKGRVPDARKMWLTAADELVCPTCAPLHEQVVALDDDFDGFISPPLHVNCRCDIVFLPPVGGTDVEVSEQVTKAWGDDKFNRNGEGQFATRESRGYGGLAGESVDQTLKKQPAAKPVAAQQKRAAPLKHSKQQRYARDRNGRRQVWLAGIGQVDPVVLAGAVGQNGNTWGELVDLKQLDTATLPEGVEERIRQNSEQQGGDRAGQLWQERGDEWRERVRQDALNQRQARALRQRQRPAYSRKDQQAEAEIDLMGREDGKDPYLGDQNTLREMVARDQFRELQQQQERSPWDWNNRALGEPEPGTQVAQPDEEETPLSMAVDEAITMLAEQRAEAEYLGESTDSPHIDVKVPATHRKLLEEIVPARGPQRGRSNALTAFSSRIADKELKAELKESPARSRRLDSEGGQQQGAAAMSAKPGERLAESAYSVPRSDGGEGMQRVSADTYRQMQADGSEVLAQDNAWGMASELESERQELAAAHASAMQQAVQITEAGAAWNHRQDIGANSADVGLELDHLQYGQGLWAVYETDGDYLVLMHDDVFSESDARTVMDTMVRGLG